MDGVDFFIPKDVNIWEMRRYLLHVVRLHQQIGWWAPEARINDVERENTVITKILSDIY